MWENEDDEDVYLDGLCISKQLSFLCGPVFSERLAKKTDTRISRYDLENV